jgi:hypothetical protein
MQPNLVHDDRTCAATYAGDYGRPKTVEAASLPAMWTNIRAAPRITKKPERIYDPIATWASCHRGALLGRTLR